jgi:hypothetical protein
MKRTQKELKPIIKKEVDAFVTEMVEKYPEILRTSLKTFIEQEMGKAFYEMEEYGKVLTNAERWK